MFTITNTVTAQTSEVLSNKFDVDKISKVIRDNDTISLTIKKQHNNGKKLATERGNTLRLHYDSIM